MSEQPHGGGWVAFYRSDLDDVTFQSPELWRLWCWCRLRASHKPRQVAVRVGRGEALVELQAGQFIFGRESARRALNCPAKTIEDRMKRLAKLGKIAMHPTRHYTLITVVDWPTSVDDVEPSRQQTRQATAHQPPGNRPPTAHRPPQTRMYNNVREGENGEQVEDRGYSSLEDAGNDFGLAHDERLVDETVDTFTHPNWLENQAETWRRYHTLEKKVTPSRDPDAGGQDQWLLLRVAFLRAMGLLAEGDVVDGIEALKHVEGPIKRPGAYFFVTLRKRLGEAKLKNLLARAANLIPSRVQRKVMATEDRPLSNRQDSTQALCSTR